MLLRAVELVSRLRNNDKGAALAEWGLLVVFIAILAVVAVAAGGTELSNTYSEISSTVDAAA